MTLNELIYSVRELLKADSDDSNVSNEFIAFLINSARVDYLKKYLNDFKKITPDSLLQTISIDLEGVDTKKAYKSFEDQLDGLLCSINSYYFYHNQSSIFKCDDNGITALPDHHKIFTDK